MVAILAPTNETIMNYSKQIIRALAAYWERDERTIRRWLSKENHPIHSSPETIRIVKSKGKPKQIFA